jgi:ATP-dependent Clp endopeptidase proteolytic subunit ClpP
MTTAPETAQRFRFKNRLPQPGEGKSLRAAIEPIVDGTVAKIRLYDPIDSWGGYWGVSAKEFAETLDGLESDVDEIRLHINSPGGEVFEAVAILNLLRNHKARVVAIVDGLAASAASFLACGADELIMADNSELMIHDAWGICIGNAADMQSMADLLGHLSDNVASIYAAKAGTDTASWRTAMLLETWYSAEEAVDAGLADRAGPVEEEGDPVEIEKDEEPDDLFDLSPFKYQGRDSAPDPSASRVDAGHVRNRDEVRHRMNERKDRARS